MKPRILICTVDSWNARVGGNTFSSLLKEYPPENLANVYIREELPDSPCCSRYFQISENRVIKSILKRKIKTGREVAACQEMTEADAELLEQSRRLYNKNRKKRSFFKLFIREVLWKLGKWKTPELNDYVDSFQPDIVVFDMSSYIHFNRICRYIIRRTEAKAVGYFWDDTFTYKQMPNFGYKALRFLKRKSLKKLAKECDAFWAITEKTKKEADAFFGIDCQIITKPIDFLPGESWQPYIPHEPIQMLYTGNLLIGRFQAIQAVSKALDRINADGTKVLLDVYSASYITPEDLATLSPYVRMRGVVPQAEVLALQEKADVLLLAEAMDGPHSQIARLSFSTKLTDYLHAGKCILSIGAAGIASMEYLQQEDAALCATNEDEVYAQLQAITEDSEMIARLAQNAFDCGKRNHARPLIREKVEQTFSALCAGSAKRKV